MEKVVIEKVVKYKASDGELYDSEYFCQLHEEQIQKQKKRYEELVFYAKTISRFCRNQNDCYTCPLREYNKGNCPVRIQSY